MLSDRRYLVVSTLQKPIIALVYLLYTNAEQNGRKNKLNTYIRTVNI